MLSEDDNVTLSCPKCGQIFSYTVKILKSGANIACPKCMAKLSAEDIEKALQAAGG